MEPAMNDEKWALEMIQEWRACVDGVNNFDYNKVNKLEALARKHQKIRGFLLKELETRKPPDRDYTMYVADMLVRIKAEEALPVMFRILQDKNQDENARWTSGEATGRFGKPALAGLTEASKSSEVFVRHCAVCSLGNLGRLKEPAVVLLLLQALQDEDCGVRKSATGSLRASPPEFAAPYLRKAIEHKNPHVRAGSASASIFLNVHFREAEKTLLELLVHPDVEVRADAVQAFWIYEDRPFSKAAVAPLCSALKDKDSRVRAGAAMGLGTLGPTAEPAVGDLIKILREDKDKIVRQDMAEALGKIGPSASAAVPALVAFIQEKDISNGFGIIALGLIGPAARDAIPVLEKILQETKDDYVTAEALAKIRGQKAPAR